jgi:hypothetical protein
MYDILVSMGSILTPTLKFFQFLILPPLGDIGYMQEVGVSDRSGYGGGQPDTPLQYSIDI